MKFNLNFNNINYIKIVYKDNSDKTCCTKAAIKSINERDIFACAKFEDGLHIKTPQDILVSFVCDNGLYRTTTTLKFLESEPPYIFFTMKTPEGLEYQQNREYFRVLMEEDVILGFDGKVIPAKIYDISANGVSLILPDKIEIPDEVYLDLLFKPKNIKTRAKFIRFDNENDKYKASFKFIDIKNADIDLISQKCIQKQLEYKRNSTQI